MLCLDHIMTRSKNDYVITKLNPHQSAFSADFFNGDIQIRETSLQALFPFPPPTPSPQQKPKPRAQELARRLYVWVLITWRFKRANN